MINQKKSANGKMIAYTQPESQVAEQFRKLRTNINFLLPENELRSIAVTSASSSEGKTTAAANLSIVYTQAGKRVLLIDGDLRQPALHQTFNLSNASGISTVLAKEDDLKNAIKPTAIERLDVLTSGPAVAMSAEFLGSETMNQLMEHLLTIYDLLVFDSPPVLLVADGQILTNKCQGTLLVINTGHTEKQLAIQAKETIESSGGKLLGAILNNFKASKKGPGNPYFQSVEPGSQSQEQRKEKKVKQDTGLGKFKTKAYWRSS
ncbi:CpsD/CapB family tyrosine-protein kinase [Planococcus shenhongbingii]|uniref:non-specific protein-tyrosine kinase n=1 Tax=Planococcus shenhongbingii TaxID=3058398 RepID=A0ABT8N9L7_9BACL|nr:CpsD/CapB family tyrosine-protein kinase [Planococcus sp. N017]MDN7244586.1 CpsD/CapB family tyrosine-protein kinase [Planococcus sp. N017]